MKRRNNPARLRASLPAPKSSGLERFFPGIDSLSDVDAFQLLIQVVCMAPPGQSDLAHRLLVVFTEFRGLEIHEVGKGFRGFEVYYLLKDGEIIDAFAS